MAINTQTDEFWNQFPLHNTGINGGAISAGLHVDQASPEVQTQPAMAPGNSAFGQAGGNGINSPTWSKGHALAGGMGNLAGLGSGLMGGLFGIGGGGNGQGAFQTIANQVMHHGGGTMNAVGAVQMRLPSGRLVQVPMTHLQEALQRGARQV